MFPILWESHSTPEIGERPQAIVNRQLVDSADLVVGIFWTRAGTPTGAAISETVEEIERALSFGRQVLLYFSDAPVAPSNVDVAQLERVRELRSEYQRRGIVFDFRSPADLASLLRSHLPRAIRQSLSRITGLPRVIQTYLERFPEFMVGHEIEAQFVRTSRESFFFAIRSLLDALNLGERFVATDSLYMDRPLVNYWATEGLNYLRHSFETTLRGVPSDRIFIVSRKDLRRRPQFVRTICDLTAAANVGAHVVEYEELPGSCLAEFALLGDQFADEVVYDFRSQVVVENRIHWSRHKITAFAEKARLILAHEIKEYATSPSGSISFDAVQRMAEKIRADLRSATRTKSRAK